MSNMELIDAFEQKVALHDKAGRMRGYLDTYHKLGEEKDLLRAEIFRRLRGEKLPK